MARSRRSCSASKELTTGTLDTRFVGATLDPLSKVASYDPQGAAIGAAYVAAWHDYVRDRLNYRPDIQFKSGIPIYSKWDYKHQPPGADKPLIMLPNVLPDLASAMKQNPTLKVMVNGGYFDVSTPYFEGMMELRHLPVPPALRSNIEYHYYQSGHMVYVHPPTLVELHDNVADFIRRTIEPALGCVPAACAKRLGAISLRAARHFGVERHVQECRIDVLVVDRVKRVSGPSHCRK